MRPEILNPFYSSISNLKGIGSRYFTLVSNLCGGSNVFDLLAHLPYNIIDRRYTCPIKDIETGKIWTGIVRIDKHLEPKSKKQPYQVICTDVSGEIVLNFFKYYKDSLKKQLPVGSLKTISGKTEWFNGHLQMSHPDYISEPSNFNRLNTLEPVYPLTNGVTNKMMLSLSAQALEKIPDFAEWLDSSFVNKNHFPTFKQALLAAHRPQKLEDLSPHSPMRTRLSYDELLSNQLALSIARSKHKKRAGRSIHGSGFLRQKLIQNLGFDLTEAQERVLSEIYQDQEAPFQALRLIQGDVGCGKTVVAMLAMLNAVECGYQTCLMAPTEILAKQHMETLSAWAEKLDIKVELLTGKIKGKKRSEILERLALGQIDILIGTHALFTEDVRFKDLAFIVVDEQHRFGVKQRLELAAKAFKPDIIVMTATPIPRTLVLTRFGDMNYSKIDELPKNRKPSDTRVIPLNKLPEVIKALQRQIALGAQAYWVCPLVDESEKSDLAAAIERFESLKKFFGQQVGLVHGQMKEKEKDAVMEQFHKGEIKILVATTVIEVGVNVKQASIMIIERAERFGLSQLHQLRGRIKRAEHNSTCLLIYGYPLSAVAKERLQIMKNSEDGFLIAEKDLELRGGGEVLGTKQSGFELFKFANLEFHKDLLYTAHKDAEMILSLDPNLRSKRGEALRILLYLFKQDDALRTYLAG